MNIIASKLLNTPHALVPQKMAGGEINTAGMDEMET